MKIFAEKYQGWEMSGLDHQERNERDDLLRRMIAASLHTDLHDVNVNCSGTSYLKGFNRRLLTVLMVMMYACAWIFVSWTSFSIDTHVAGAILHEHAR